VRGAIELAARAPSIHHSQPWRWQITENAVRLYADRSRWLPVTDADGRDLIAVLARRCTTRAAQGDTGVPAANLPSHP
jgi:nitroreductase